jgi:hypothetical protein
VPEPDATGWRMSLHGSELCIVSVDEMALVSILEEEVKLRWLEGRVMLSRWATPEMTPLGWLLPFDSGMAMMKDSASP